MKRKTVAKLIDNVLFWSQNDIYLIYYLFVKKKWKVKTACYFLLYFYAIYVSIRRNVKF